MDEVRVVVAHSERATLRVGDMFLKVDGDPARLDREARVMALAPIPTPEVRFPREGEGHAAALERQRSVPLVDLQALHHEPDQPRVDRAARSVSRAPSALSPPTGPTARGPGRPRR